MRRDAPCHQKNDGTPPIAVSVIARQIASSSLAV
jgi:hypothetical protein